MFMFMFNKKKLLIITFFLIGIFLFIFLNNNKEIDNNSKYIKAEVKEVGKIKKVEDAETKDAFTQKIIVEKNNDEKVEIVNEYIALREGQDIFIKKQEETEEYRVVEINRTKYNLFFLFFFLGVIFSFMGKKAWKSILSLIFSVLIILFVLIPIILNGGNILFWSVILVVIILAVVMFFTHGINKKTFAAFSGTSAVIFLTGIMSYFAVKTASFNGLSDDNAFNLYIMGVDINFSELLLSGILIGIVGLLDDVAITQAAIVQELKDLGLSSKEIYKKAMVVGEEHIGAMVNTIILAYAGAFFPLIIWFYNSGENLEFLLSKEIISSEILRTLIGSIGLILTVPLVTFISILIIKKNN